MRIQPTYTGLILLKNAINFFECPGAKTIQLKLINHPFSALIAQFVSHGLNIFFMILNFISPHQLQQKSLKDKHLVQNHKRLLALFYGPVD